MSQKEIFSWKNFTSVKPVEKVTQLRGEGVEVCKIKPRFLKVLSKLSKDTV